MTVDVSWDGVPLAKAATARAEGGDWFVELEQPMPVGTLLTLAGDVQATVQVTRVHEGIGAGMVVRKSDGRPSAVEPEKSDENGKKEKRKKRR
jgi:hypothetical protein